MASSSRDPGFLLNSQALPGYVSPEHGHGTFVLQGSSKGASHPTHVWWQIADVCLKYEEEGFCKPEHSAKTVIFEMYQFGKLAHPGFTITYRHSARPELIRFSPFYDWNAAFSPPELSDHWNPSSLLSSISSSTGDESSYPEASPVYSITISSLNGPASLPTGSIANPISGTLLSGFIPTATAIVTGFVAGANQDRVFNQGPSETSIPTAQIVQVEALPLCSLGLALHAIQNKLKDFVTTTKNHYNSIRPNVARLQHTLDSFPNSLGSTTLGAPTSIQEGSFGGPEASVTSLISSNKLIEAPLPSPTPFYIQKSSHDHIIRALKITSFAFIIVCISALVFSHFVSSPRRRADRAARREECRNRRLYQHAAHKYMWQRRWEAFLGKFVSRNITEVTVSAWDDKILPPLPTLSTQDNIRNELRAMRNTYKVVDSIVQAEEGRRSAIPASPQKFVLRRWERRASRTSRSSSDVTGPPPYEELFDGYHYIPPEADTTPDSSVIDTSSRNDSDCEKD